MMLGNVEGAEAGLVEQLHQFEAAVVGLVHRDVLPVEMIDDAKFDRHCLNSFLL